MRPRDLGLARALLLRDTNGAALLRGAALWAVLGCVAAWIASTMSGSGGIASVILRFDRTMAVLLAMHVVFRTIAVIDGDAQSDWVLQLVAGGASRSVYILAAPLGVAFRTVPLYMAGAVLFALLRIILSRQHAIIGDVVTTLPLVLLMFGSASVFGAAIASLVRGRTANYIAAAIVASPWIALVLSASNVDPVAGAPAFSVVDALGWLPPRLWVAFSIAHVSYVVMHSAALTGVALFAADGRVGRRR